MGKTKNTIKINGHLYDAISGALISRGSGSLPKTTVKNLDGVLPGSVITPLKPATHRAPKSAAPAKKPTHTQPKHAVQRSPQTTTHHAVQHSKTLMRHAVTKPSHEAHHFKVQSPTHTIVKHPVSPKVSVQRVNEHRLMHAKRVGKSQHISRFGKNAPLLSAAAKPHTSARRSPAPQAVVTRRPHHVQKHEKTTADILQDALHHATSHKQPAPKKRLTRKQQVTSFSALTVATGLLIGIVALQSVPTIKMHIASAKAGFAATLPGYQPSGFHLGELDYSAGAVAMNYKSNSDQSRKFAITQKSTQWDSATLRDVFVQPNDKSFKAVEDGGRTFYLYGKNNATWVDNGVWYQVQGTDTLNSRQLVDIAKSL